MVFYMRIVTPRQVRKASRGTEQIIILVKTVNNPVVTLVHPLCDNYTVGKKVEVRHILTPQI